MRALLFIVAAVFVCGCTLLPCSEPMKRVGGDCCIDSNNNQVCDIKEVGNVSTVNCHLPYIPYNKTCCLDSNGNRVCDFLESPPQTSPPSARTYSTAAYEATSTTGSASTSTSSTSSTTSTSTTGTSATTTSTTMGPCFDSDGGDTLHVAGWVRGKNRVPPHNNVTEHDYCITNQSVREYHCEGEYVYGNELLCGSFEVCSLGRCCLPSGSRCGSSSSCCSGECRKKLYISLCD